jgi:hypothetical protein
MNWEYSKELVRECFINIRESAREFARGTYGLLGCLDLVVINVMAIFSIRFYLLFVNAQRRKNYG